MFRSGTIEQVKQAERNYEPLIIAHRGASFNAPENTLAAFQMAVDAGADGIEFDVRISKDRVPVVIHDETLSRTALRPEKVSDLTHEELSRIDVGSWFNTKFSKRFDPAFARETIPTLAQVLHLLRSFDGLIYVELKVENDDRHRLAEAVCAVIRDSPLRTQIIVKSFDLAVIREIKERLECVQTAALFQPTIIRYLRGRKHLIETARRFGADQLSLHYSLATRMLVSLASEFEIPVTIWTVDNPAWLKQCRKLGVRALITNDLLRMLTARHLRF